jgi:hypothetical protein
MGDSISSLTDPRPAGDPSPHAPRLCEFCESRLTQTGQVLSMSEKARQLRTLDDRLSNETAAHNATKADLAAARARVAELEAALTPPAPAKTNSWLGFEE